MSKLAEKLAQRIKKEFDIDVIPKIYRTRAGYWQRSRGAWSWFMLTEDNKDVGSLWSAITVLNARKLSDYWTDITQCEILVEKL